MKIITRTILIALGLLAFVYACDPIESYPETPEVKFKSLHLSNAIDGLGNQIKLVKLTISVIDGDGDLGISLNNQIYPGFEELDTADLHISLYDKIDGEFEEVILANPHKFATPYQAPEGQDKSIVADLEVTLEYSISKYTFDTIKYSFHMYDRALHKSNIAESPEIPADTLGLIE